MALLATPLFVTFFMWWILVEMKYMFINDVKHFKGFYICFYSEVYSTFVTYYLSISYSLVNLNRWIVVIQSGYNILYVVFNTREFHKMSNPIIRPKFKIRFFNPLKLFKAMKYYLCLIWTLPEKNYTFDF